MSIRDLRVIVVDDEPIARRHIQRLLQPIGDVRVLADCGNGRAAVASIVEMHPDLVFLDVQIPGLDGFQVLEKLPPDRLPLIIFTTAFDQYAIRAFEIHAVDYLLKPFDDDRFYLALERARETLARPKEEILRRLLDLIDDLKGQGSDSREGDPDQSDSGDSHGFLERIVVKSTGRIQLVKTVEIERIKAAGQYVALKAGNQEHLIRQTMDHLESRLDPKRFLRIHRSTIVNIDFIKEIRPWGKSQYAITMRSGEQFVSSYGHRQNLDGLMRDT